MDPFISLIFFLFAHRTSDEVSDSGFWEPLVLETMLKIKVLSLILSSSIGFLLLGKETRGSVG
jgi:hypothetical protein